MDFLLEYYQLFFILLLAVIFALAANFLFNLVDKYISQVCDVIKTLCEDMDANIVFKDQRLNKFYNAISDLQRTVKKREQYHNEIFKILNSAAINIELDKFLSDFVPKLLGATESFCGAFYILNDFTNKLEIKYSYGFDKNIYKEFDLNANEIVPSDNNVKVINDIPDDTIYIAKTFIGKIKPKSMVIIPIVNENNLIGILVFASIYNYTDEQIEIINLTKHYVGIAVNNGIIFEKSKRLTNELQFQNKLIQELNDELEKKLKGNNED